MMHQLFSGSRPLQRASLFFCAGLILSGCGYDDIRVYQVPKEQPETELVRQTHAHDHDPHIHWGELPPNWRAEPAGAMRAASFLIAGADGAEIDLSVIPLPDMAGGDLDNVNRWRNQLRLAPITSDELVQTARTVQIGADQGQLFEMVSEEPLADGRRLRVLAVIFSAGDLTWFFKMTGEEAAVTQEKEPFIEFLKSVTIHDGSEHQGEQDLELAATAPAHPLYGEEPASPTYGSAGTDPQWTVPGSWQEQPAPPMVSHSFLVTDASGGNAVIEISRFPGDVGGIFLNVNRWRGQIGLPPIEPDELREATRSVDVIGGEAILVDMTGSNPRTGQPARMIVATVPRGEQTWFYKMTGDPAVVEKEQEQFIQFVKAVRYPNG